MLAHGVVLQIFFGIIMQLSGILRAHYCILQHRTIFGAYNVVFLCYMLCAFGLLIHIECLAKGVKRTEIYVYCA